MVVEIVARKYGPMKPISQRRALGRLSKIRDDLRSEILRFETRAKSCLTCETQGACCLDQHFVNVHVSRLEAQAIKNTLADMPAKSQQEVNERIEATIENHRLTSDGDTFSQGFACPLFEKGVGCLVHSTAKPIACIVHACYESKTDLPPDDLQTAAEAKIDGLNSRVYGRPQSWLPLPLAIRRPGVRGDAI